MLTLIAVLSLAMLSLAVSIVMSGCGDPMAQARDLEDQGDLGAAVALYQEVLQDEPDNAEALLGAALDLSFLGRFDEALVFQERLAAVDAEDAQIRTELGFNYLNHQDRPSDAVRVFAEAAVLEPSAKHLTYLAQAQLAAGEVAEAEETLRAAIGLDPSYANSYNVLVRLLQQNGRTNEAQQVVQEASLQGVTIEDLQ
ncbi:MAG: hypothetical protein A2133_11930 [Actinobacteria bacterium RBG_16_64_13]|nr:MAG: hypothetical protein A2133_11930 [Actinobacteria bacterium RBG_16_64_13]